MPYYRHLKDVDIADDVNSYVSYGSMQDAREGINVKTETVTFIASADEQYTWRMRENDRFAENYIKVPWHVAHYWDSRPENIRYHFAHLSLKSPGLVAYTKNDEHGVNDRQTAVKPAKYLAEFYPDEFSEETIREYVAQCSITAQDFKLATSETDITSIFGRTTSGFTSCMQSKRTPEYSWDKAFQNGDRKHPCAVYGDSDLAVAYLGDLEGSVTARVVVWPEKKIINLRSDGTVYGDQTLKHILLANGYKIDSIVGAKVRLLRGPNGGIILPYVDNLDWANVFDDKFVILDDRRNDRTSLNCSNHETGYGDDTSDGWNRDDENDDGDSDWYTCERCNERYDYNEMQNGSLNQTYCDSCIDRSSICDHCDTRHWGDNETVGAETWCERCVSVNIVNCQHPTLTRGEGLQPCGESWIEVGEFDSTEQADRVRHHTAHLCRAHAEGMQTCTLCAAVFDASAMQCDCGLTVRCERTIAITFDLPIGADGSMWWQAVGRHEDPTKYWAIVNGQSHHTCAPAFVLGGSTFETLDHMPESYRRVPDPRPTVQIESSPF